MNILAKPRKASKYKGISYSATTLSPTRICRAADRTITKKIEYIIFRPGIKKYSWSFFIGKKRI